MHGQSAADPGFREDAVYLGQRRPPMDVQLGSSRCPDGRLPSLPDPTTFQQAIWHVGFVLEGLNGSSLCFWKRAWVWAARQPAEG